MTRKRTRDDKQEPKIFTKRLLANRHHLLAGDQALRVAAGFGLARFCPQVQLVALTEHEERCTVASESLPANFRKTIPAHDMRSCILNRETKRTRLEAQWSTTRDCLFSHLDMGSIGWVEKHFVYRDIGCRRLEGAIFECFWCAPQMRGLPHIAEKFKIEIFEARLLHLLRPHICRSQIRTPNLLARGSSTTCFPFRCPRGPPKQRCSCP